MAVAEAKAQAIAFDDDLSDEQIQALLDQATERLREKAILQEKEDIKDGQVYTFPKLDTGIVDKPYVTTRGAITTFDAQCTGSSVALGARKVEDPVAAKKYAMEKKKATAGRDWFDLPRTNLTPELKRDLQLIKMRNVLDPHRHYKKDGGKLEVPEYSQVGTIIEGPTEFFSGRIENKKRKRTFVEEVLAGEQETGRFKRKYGDIQTKKTSGKKAFYKALKAKRKSGVKKGSG